MSLNPKPKVSAHIKAKDLLQTSMTANQSPEQKMVVALQSIALSLIYMNEGSEHSNEYTV